MLVYGYLVVSGMAFPGYDSGFHPSRAFFWMPWCWDVYFCFLIFGFLDGFWNPGQRWSQGSFPNASESLDQFWQDTR